MPSSVTHLIIGKEVSHRLSYLEKPLPFSLEEQKICKSSLGQDLTYHNNSLFSYTHKHNTQAFLIYFLLMIKDTKALNNQNIISLFYGHIIHYVTDRLIHPYIYFFDKGLINHSIIHNHQILEWQLDQIIYKIKDPTFDLNIIKTNLYDKDTKNFINNLYYNLYHVNNISKTYQITEQEIYLLTKLIKTISPNYSLPNWLTKNFLANNQLVSLDFLLNKDHYPWYNPFTYQLKNDSLEDLYQQAIITSLTIINEINNYLFYHGNLTTIIKAFPNKSYDTNAPCSHYNQSSLRCVQKNDPIMSKYLKKN